MKEKFAILGLITLLCQGSYAQIKTSEITVEERSGTEIFGINPSLTLSHQSDGASSLNFKNTEGFWHISGPRSFENNAPFSIYWNAGTFNRYFTILNSGNIGMGVDNPQVKLHIGGSIRGNLSGGALRISTEYGTIDIGSRNSGWAHFYTHRDKFYFSKEIRVNGKIGSHNNDLLLSTGGVTRMTVLGSSGNVGIGTPDPQEKLHVNGDVKIDENVTADNIAGVKSINKSLKVTTSWLNSGIKRNDLSTGTYAVQVYVHNKDVGGGHYYEYYSGIMSWYSSYTNSTVTDEIPLHLAGHAPNSGRIYLRIARSRNADGGDLHLQIRSNVNTSGNSNYVFKFKKLI